MRSMFESFEERYTLPNLIFLRIIRLLSSMHACLKEAFVLVTEVTESRSDGRNGGVIVYNHADTAFRCDQCEWYKIENQTHGVNVS
jgi:hypothetical protein